MTDELEDLKDAKLSGEERKAKLEAELKQLKIAIDTIKGQVDLAAEDVDKAFYEAKGKRYSDVDLKDLVVIGKVSTRQKNKIFEFEITNLTKGESLEVDRMTKDLRNETGQYMQQMIIVHILAKALKRYGVPDQTKPIPDKMEEAIKVLSQINETVITRIWSEYIDFTRWVNCALRFELKNS